MYKLNHAFQCQNDWFHFAAFSKFATAEYFVAVTNMAFYWTLTHDLSTEEVVVIRPPTATSSTSYPPPPPASTTTNSDRGTVASSSKPADQVDTLQNCSIEKKDPHDNSGNLEIEYSLPPPITALEKGSPWSNHPGWTPLFKATCIGPTYSSNTLHPTQSPHSP